MRPSFCETVAQPNPGRSRQHSLPWMGTYVSEHGTDMYVHVYIISLIHKRVHGTDMYMNIYNCM
jgi:hypothetical protein